MKPHEIFLLCGLIGVIAGAILLMVSDKFYNVLETIFRWLGGIVLAGSLERYKMR